jgi:tetratricopeptide (TPR) repeat protein
LQANHLRILELRDRIRTTPAPFLYAQLAEEYRRARDVEEAVTTCRECLAKYPAYLSVRVILGRALAERGDLAAAAAEFTQVLGGAPDNLTATRDLAEVELRLGHPDRALEQFRRALALVRDDTELEGRVETLARLLASGVTAETAALASTRALPSVERDTAVASTGSPSASVDFDAILSFLGATDQRLPPLMEMLLMPVSQPPRSAEFSSPSSVSSERCMQGHPVLAQLEAWLAAIETHRKSHPAFERHANRPA